MSARLYRLTTPEKAPAQWAWRSRRYEGTRPVEVSPTRPWTLLVPSVVAITNEVAQVRFLCRNPLRSAHIRTHPRVQTAAPPPIWLGLQAFRPPAKLLHTREAAGSNPAEPISKNWRTGASRSCSDGSRSPASHQSSGSSYSHGLSSATSQSWKSLVLRVTTVRSWTWAVAAIRLSTVLRLAVAIR